MAEIPLFAYLALGVVLALFTSEQVLTDHPAHRAFADWMASIVPSIDPISRISAFPEVARFFFSVMSFVAPIVIASYLWTKIIQPWTKGTVPRF